MVFAHGFGCDQNMWRLVTPGFEADYSIVLFDHVGAGDSALTEYDVEKYATLRGYADDVLDICDALDLSDVIYVGHSVSAMIGVLAVTKRPQIFDKLVMVGPSPRYVNDGEYTGGFSREDIDGLLDSLDSNYLGWSRSMAPAIMGNTDRPELGEELANSFCRTDPEIAKHFARATFLADNREDLASVRTPTLIIQSAVDAIAPPEVGAYVHSQLADSELIVLDVDGHCPNLSAPDETVSAISQYLRAHV